MEGHKPAEIKDWYPNEEEIRRTEVYMKEALSRPLIITALGYLDRLPPEFELVYHTKAHTLDVIHDTILFAICAGESEDVIFEQATAAAWHDVGFADSKTKNEQIAADEFGIHAEGVLPAHVRERIQSEILDTAVKINERGEMMLKPEMSRSEQKFRYMLDGDVSNFGRLDFFEQMHRVREEVKVPLNDRGKLAQFYRNTLALMKNHTWQTKSAYRLREIRKQKNMRQLEKMIADPT